MKQAMASAEIHKTIVHIFALVLATGGQVSPGLLLRSYFYVILMSTFFVRVALNFLETYYWLSRATLCRSHRR